MNDVIYRVVGIKVGTFEDRNTKEKLSYGKLFCVTVGCKAEGLDGEMTESFSVKPDILEESGVELDDEVKLFFNRYGKVSVVEVVG